MNIIYYRQITPSVGFVYLTSSPLEKLFYLFLILQSLEAWDVYFSDTLASKFWDAFLGSILQINLHDTWKAAGGRHHFSLPSGNSRRHSRSLLNASFWNGFYLPCYSTHPEATKYQEMGTSFLHVPNSTNRGSVTFMRWYT